MSTKITTPKGITQVTTKTRAPQTMSEADKKAAEKEARIQAVKSIDFNYKKAEAAVVSADMKAVKKTFEDGVLSLARQMAKVASDIRKKAGLKDDAGIPADYWNAVGVPQAVTKKGGSKKHLGYVRIGIALSTAASLKDFDAWLKGKKVKKANDKYTTRSFNAASAYAAEKAMTPEQIKAEAGKAEEAEKAAKEKAAMPTISIRINAPMIEMLREGGLKFEDVKEGGSGVIDFTLARGWDSPNVSQADLMQFLATAAHIKSEEAVVKS